MKCERTTIISSEEIQILAAASGLKFMPIYEAGGLFSRTKQIEAIYALLRDGLLTPTRQGMTLGDGLRPFSSALQKSKAAVTVTALHTGTPPICIFGSDENSEYMYVMPTESRVNYYRVGLLPERDLLEMLEQMYVLPTLHNHCNCSENIIDKTEIFTRLERLENWNVKAIYDCFGSDLISTFEKYNLNNSEHTEKLLVLFSVASYIIAKWSRGKKEIISYKKEAIARWIKEQTNDMR